VTEEALDYGRTHGMNIVGGYLSPVSDGYKKKVFYTSR
jgi:hypothetical protein